LQVKDSNAPPVFQDVPNQTAQPGQSTQLIVRATDPDGKAPVLTVRGLPAFATFTPGTDGTATLRFNPTVLNGGNHVITLIATDDGKGDPKNRLRKEEAFVLNVPVPNSPRVISYVGDRVAVAGEDFVIRVRVSDRGEGALTFLADSFAVGGV